MARDRGVAEPTFPDIKPPFLNQQYVRAGPGGEIWLRPVLPPGSSDTASVVYDVIDRAGNRIRRVVHSDRLRLLGFGTRMMYFARTDTLGFVFLEGYEPIR
jgi:hypothetical protein